MMSRSGGSGRAKALAGSMKRKPDAITYSEAQGRSRRMRRFVTGESDVRASWKHSRVWLPSAEAQKNGGPVARWEPNAFKRRTAFKIRQ
jgi:hypothetical protein